MTIGPTIGSPTDRTPAPLEVHLLGVVDYESALFLQERLVYEISDRADGLGGLLLCEHPPLITIGRGGSRAHILVDPDELESRQMGVRWVNRGGGCLAHAPGQLAVYPIVPLDRLGLGLDDYRRLIEESVVDACRELRLSASRRPDQPGVWCREGQLAHLGIAVKSWVASHGIFVNVNPAMEFLRLVRPNRTGERVTSLAAARLKPTSMHKIRESLIRNLASRLGYERQHVYTGHPLLRRTKKKVYVNA